MRIMVASPCGNSVTVLKKLEIDELKEGMRVLGQKSTRIPASMVGKIIGKGGSTIKSIQSLSGARVAIVQVGKNHEARISGDARKVKSAQNLIQNLIGPCRSVIKVNHLHMGIVVGAGGSNIKQIQKETGATITITKPVVKGKQEIPVEISGTKEQIREAEEKIANLIAGMPLKFAEQTRLHTEITVSGCKLYLKKLDKNISENDLMSLYSGPTPQIVIRVDKGGGGKYATCTFECPAIAKSFMEELNGKLLGSRRLVCKKEL